jgi:hypothetical protein
MKQAPILAVMVLGLWVAVLAIPAPDREDVAVSYGLTPMGAKQFVDVCSAAERVGNPVPDIYDWGRENLSAINPRGEGELSQMLPVWKQMVKDEARKKAEDERIRTDAQDRADSTRFEANQANEAESMCNAVLYSKRDGTTGP